jgi:hypothetical protein
MSALIQQPRCPLGGKPQVSSLLATRLPSRIQALTGIRSGEFPQEFSGRSLTSMQAARSRSSAEDRAPASRSRRLACGELVVGEGLGERW